MPPHKESMVWGGVTKKEDEDVTERTNRLGIAELWRRKGWNVCAHKHTVSALPVHSTPKRSN